MPLNHESRCKSCVFVALGDFAMLCLAVRAYSTFLCHWQLLGPVVFVSLSDSHYMGQGRAHGTTAAAHHRLLVAATHAAMPQASQVYMLQPQQGPLILRLM